MILATALYLNAVGLFRFPFKQTEKTNRIFMHTGTTCTGEILLGNGCPLSSGLMRDFTL